MTVSSCAEVARKFVEAQEGRFACLESDGRTRIITPYPYPDNDLIEVWVEPATGDRVKVTDLGETVRHLYASGYDVGSARRRMLLAQTVAAGRGVEFDEGEISKVGSVEELGELLFDVVVTSRGISDLILTSRAYEPATFREEVAGFLEESAIPFETGVRVAGHTGKVYRVDFRLPPSGVLLQTLSPAQPGAMQGVINRVFRVWVDVNGQIGRSRKVCLLNDVDFRWAAPDVALLDEVAQVAYWTRREQLLGIVQTQ
jgi:hypothetical protein